MLQAVDLDSIFPLITKSMPKSFGMLQVIFSFFNLRRIADILHNPLL